MFGLHRPKRRQVGPAGRLVRYRDGTCAFTCYHAGCRAWWLSDQGWSVALPAARAHAARHAADGRSAVDRPVRRGRGRLAAVLVVLLLAATAFFTVANVTSRAAPAPPATTVLAAHRPASTGPTGTTTARPAPGPYIPRPAGPPATDQGGQWLPAPAPAGPTSSSSSSSTAGGGR